MQVDFVFQIAVLIMSVVIHEVSHGYAASYLGDQTARYQGRLTLNPLKHLDFVGSFLVPSLSYFLGALIFGILLRISVSSDPAFIQITSLIVFINILLAIFNLMPIPPLDGSKLLFAIFPDTLFQIRGFFEKYGLMLVLFFIFFLWQFIFTVIAVLFRLITGVAI